jgi:hypothetical protein
MATIPSKLKQAWDLKIGGRLSSPVIAQDTAIVSAIDAHRIVAIDTTTDKIRWEFLPGGPVDSAPTIHQGQVLFGCAYGWVYCLCLSDGELAWQFRAAPEARKTVALDQVESVWPVHGSILVQNGVAYASAGRSTWIDGGIHAYGLDPATGKVVSQSNVVSTHPTAEDGRDSDIQQKHWTQNATDAKTFEAPDRSDAFSMGGATNDILVGDGESVFMRHVRFDRKCVQQEKMGRHLFSTSKLLDGAENHRSHWVLGTGDFSRTGIAYSWIANRDGGRGGNRLAVPYGLMLTFDDEKVWGVRRGGRDIAGYRLYARANRPLGVDEPHKPDFGPIEPKANPYAWINSISLRPRAIVRAGDTLIVGGTPTGSGTTELAAAFAGEQGGLLHTFSTKDGAQQSEIKLDAPPVWDGMAVAGNQLYFTTIDGRIVCYGGK